MASVSLTNNFQLEPLQQDEEGELQEQLLDACVGPPGSISACTKVKTLFSLEQTSIQFTIQIKFDKL